jgi:hypothetical protein
MSGSLYFSILRRKERRVLEEGKNPERKKSDEYP